MREGLTTIGELIASALIVAGCAAIYVPLALIVAGVLLGTICWLVAR